MATLKVGDRRRACSVSKLLLLLAVVALLGGCTEPVEEVDAVDGQTLHNLNASHNKLGLLVQDALIRGGDKGKNVFISPLSISAALSMLSNGAAGETAAAFSTALQWNEIDLETINRAHRVLLDTFRDSETALGVRLHIANAVWHRQDFTLRPQFVEDSARYYDALAHGLDFSDPAGPRVINEWVSNQTKGLIANLVDQLDDDLVTLLVNTVYFKGNWTTPFKSGFTHDDTFHLASGATRTVPFMYSDGRFDHLAGTDFEAVRLPYGDEGRMAMYVFVPSADSNVEDFVQHLREEPQQWFTGFTPKRGEVRLPRLDIGYKTNLNDVLQSLDLGIAFDPLRADFSNMATGPAQGSGTRDKDRGAEDRGAKLGPKRLYISDVIHQAVLRVDEAGTEAAAATSFGVRTTSMPLHEFRLTADRPFFLAIRDDVTGSLLFIGSIYDPE